MMYHMKVSVIVRQFVNKFKNMQLGIVEEEEVSSVFFSSFSFIYRHFVLDIIVLLLYVFKKHTVNANVFFPDRG